MLLFPLPTVSSFRVVSVVSVLAGCMAQCRLRLPSFLSNSRTTLFLLVQIQIRVDEAGQVHSSGRVHSKRQIGRSSWLVLQGVDEASWRFAVLSRFDATLLSRPTVVGRGVISCGCKYDRFLAQEEAHTADVQS